MLSSSIRNPFDVMPCINPLSIVRYTMGDKSLSDPLFRLRPVNILYIQMSNYAVFLKGGDRKRKCFHAEHLHFIYNS